MNRLKQFIDLDNREWAKDAACHNSDPDLFYPNGTTGIELEQAEIAKQVCATCIAKVACLEYAIDNKEQYGVWGGTTEEERRLIIKQRKDLPPESASA